MVTTTESHLTCQKLDTAHFSFRDLPGEVRNRIYDYYCSLPDGLTIHLVSVRYPVVPRNEFHISSIHHTRLQHSVIQAHPDDFGGNEYRLDSPTLHIGDGEADKGLRTSLLRTCKAIHAEAQEYADQMNRFRVLGNGHNNVHEGYHRELGSIDRSICARIKSLELGPDIVDPWFNPNFTNWTINFWNDIVMDMRRLEHLTLTNQPSCEIHEILLLFRMESASFLGAKPVISIELELGHTVLCWCHEEGSIAGQCHCNGGGYVLEVEDSPRFIVPPLKTITMRGMMVEGHRSIFEALGGVHLLGSRPLSRGNGGKDVCYYKYEY